MIFSHPYPLLFSLLPDSNSKCAREWPGETVAYIGHFTAIRHRDVPLTIGALLIFGSTIADPSKFVRAHACTLIGDLVEGGGTLKDAGSVNSFQQRVNTTLCALLAKEAPTPVGGIATTELPWSYCGSFVVALEDEFELVRLAVIDAMKRMAAVSSVFALASTDFLLDAFQDESTVVKIAALQALRSVYEIHGVTASQAQLESTLAHQDDTDERSRRAARSLLASLRFSGGEDLVRVVKCLANAMNKYWDEADAYAASLCQLGARNAALVAEHASSYLIHVDRYFLVVEPKIEDYSYQARLLLILGALPSRPEMIRALPAFVKNHYHFARLRYPLAVPSLQGHPQLHDLLYKCPSSSSSAMSKELMQGLRSSLLTKALPVTLRTGQDRERLRMMIRYNVFQFSPGFCRLLLDLLDLDDGSVEGKEEIEGVERKRKCLLLRYVNVPEGLRIALLSHSSPPIPYADCLVRVTGHIGLFGDGTLSAGRGGTRVMRPDIPLRVPILGHVNQTREEIEGRIYFIRVDPSGTSSVFYELDLCWQDPQPQHDQLEAGKDDRSTFQQILCIPSKFLSPSETSPAPMTPLLPQTATVSLCVGQEPVSLAENCQILDSFTLILEPLSHVSRQGSR